MAVNNKGRRLPIREAAAELGVREKTLRDWIWRRKIEYYKLKGGAIRIDSAVIEKLLDESRVPALEAR